MVGVLIFIDQNVAETRTKTRFSFWEFLQDLHGLHDEIIKIHSVCLLEALFVQGVDVGDNGFKLIGGVAQIFVGSLELVLCIRDEILKLARWVALGINV